MDFFDRVKLIQLLTNLKKKSISIAGPTPNPMRKNMELTLWDKELAELLLCNESMRALYLNAKLQLPPCDDREYFDHMVKILLSETDAVTGIKIPAAMKIESWPCDTHVLERVKALRHCMEEAKSIWVRFLLALLLYRIEKNEQAKSILRAVSTANEKFMREKASELLAA